MKNLILWVLLLSVLLPRGTGVAAQEVNTWGKLQSQGEAAAKQGDYATAEQLWLQARSEAAKFDTADIRVGITLKALGELYTTQRRYDRAEEIYRELLQSMLAGKAGNILIAPTEALLAGVCARQNKNDDAKHWYTSAAVHLQTVIGEDESGTMGNLLGRDLGNIYDSLGKLDLRSERLTDAEKHFQQSLQIRQKYLPKDDHDIADGLNNLGLVYKKLGRYRDAELYTKRATDQLQLQRDSVALATPLDKPATASAQASAPSAAFRLPPANNGIVNVEAANRFLPAGSKPIVEITNPGREPRVDLSYSIPVGAPSKFELAMDMAFSLTKPGQGTKQMAAPLMKIVMEVTVVDRNANGDFKVHAKVAGVKLVPRDEVQERIARQTGREMSRMKGVAITGWVSPKGYAHDVAIQGPANPSPKLRKMAEDMKKALIFSPLPADKVGVGGSWKIIRRDSSGDLDKLVVENRVLKELSANRAVVELTETGYAVGDSMGSDNTVRLTTFELRAEGVNAIDLRQPLAEGSVHSRVAMEVVASSSDAQETASSIVEGKGQVTRVSEAPVDAATRVNAATEGRILLSKAIQFIGRAEDLARIRAWRFHAVRRWKSGDKELTSEYDIIRQGLSLAYWSDGKQTQVVTPLWGYTKNAQGTITEMVADQREEYTDAFKGAIFAIAQRANDPAYTFAAAGSGKIGDVETKILDINADGAAVRWYIDPKDGRIVRVSRAAYGGTVDTAYDYSDWKTFDGVRYPCRSVEISAGAVTEDLSNVEINPEIDAALFARP